MKSRIFANSGAGLFTVALLLASASPVFADYESNLEKSFRVSAGGKLIVDADRGSIEVTTADADKVAVQVFRKVKGESKSRSDEIFADHEVTFSQEGNSVTVRAKSSKDNLSSLWKKIWSNYQVRYQISVPKKFNADLKTAGGGIMVSDLAGELRGVTSGGSLKFGRIQGPVIGKTSGGGITLAACDDTVDARTSGGSIHINQAKGKVIAKTSGGSIHIDETENDIAAETSGGSITIKRTKGKVSAHTSGGGIEVLDALGAVEASTSGGSISASLSEQPQADCSLKTSGGSIKVNLKESVAMNVDARTSGGRVVTDLPVSVQGAMKRSELHGKVNGGGPALVLQTSGGSIYLQKR